MATIDVQIQDNAFLPFGLRPLSAPLEPLGESEMYRHEVDRARANDAARTTALCATLMDCRASWSAPAMPPPPSLPSSSGASGDAVAVKGGMPFLSYEERMMKVLRAHAEKKRVEAEEEKKAMTRARKSRRPSDTGKKSTM